MGYDRTERSCQPDACHWEYFVNEPRVAGMPKIRIVGEAVSICKN